MRQILRRIPLAGLSVILFVLSTASPAQAQYFGRNKVQYKEFKFEVVDAIGRSIEAIEQDLRSRIEPIVQKPRRLNLSLLDIKPR